jgi:hypothetical protein
MKNPKVGQKVEDTWYIEMGTGTIKHVLKTRIKIHFPRLEHININKFWLDDNGHVTYDKPHYKFLKLVDK